MHLTRPPSEARITSCIIIINNNNNNNNNASTAL